MLLKLLIAVLSSLLLPGLLQVNYCEEAGSFNQRLPGPKGERRVFFMNREDLDIDVICSPKIRSNVDSGKGVRIQVRHLVAVLNIKATFQPPLATMADVPPGTVFPHV